MPRSRLKDASQQTQTDAPQQTQDASQQTQDASQGDGSEVQPPAELVGGDIAGAAVQVEQIQAATERPISEGPTQDVLDRAGELDDAWLMYNKGYWGQRYSGLDQIDTENVSDLEAVCAFQTGEAGITFEASPIVWEGVAYFTTSYNTYAIDARTCELRWKHTYVPEGPEPFTTNRGVAIGYGRVYRGTSDAHFLALDAKTGELLWEIAPVDSGLGYFLSSSPIVWNGLVITGTAGADWGANGRVFAFDAATGDLVWWFDEIVPDTFGSAEAAAVGGGSNWTGYTIDPATNTLYVPVGNPAPDFACEFRPGANLYTNSVVALDATSGELKYWYQQIPHDCLDRDTAAPPVLYRTRDGQRYLAVGSKNGLMYVYDDEATMQAARRQADGEGDAQDGDAQQPAIADAFQEAQDRVGQRDLPPQQNEPWQSVGDALAYVVPVTTRTNVDARPTEEGVYVCPGVNGGVEWFGPTFDPENHSLYVPSVDWCSTFTLSQVRYDRGQFFFGGAFSFEPISKAQGWIQAFDADTGRELWQYRSDRPVVAALTPTAGGLVFAGELTGDFVALDAQTGEDLYRFQTGGPIAAGISTYEMGGRQYVLVPSGNTSRTWNPDTGASATIFIFALGE